MSRLPPHVDTWIQRLDAATRRQVRTDIEARKAAARDASDLPDSLPAAVARPQNLAQVVSLAQNASQSGVALVPRGAGTGKAGGCLAQPDQVVVDLSGMDRLLRVADDDSYAIVQPGLVTGTFDAVLQAEHNAFFPPDPASLATCTLGGNIATNAGGPRAFKYGVTRNYVWGIELVKIDGTVLRMGRRCLKSVAGLELAGLVVGSEGTLGFITEATLRVLPLPEATAAAWCTFASRHEACRAAAAMLKCGVQPSMLELLDGPVLEALAHAVDASSAQPGAALLLQADGTAQAAPAVLERLCEVAAKHGARTVDQAAGVAEQEVLLARRRRTSEALRAQYPHKCSDDVTLPRSKVVSFLEQAERLVAQVVSQVRVCAYGHLGDGNLHLNLLAQSAQLGEQAKALRPSLLRMAIAMGGTVSGEHGIGLAKRSMLHEATDPHLIQLQRHVKALFDPNSLMNPGKVYSAGCGDTARGEPSSNLSVAKKEQAAVQTEPSANHVPGPVAQTQSPSQP